MRGRSRGEAVGDEMWCCQFGVVLSTLGLNTATFYLRTTNVMVICATPTGVLCVFACLCLVLGRKVNKKEALFGILFSSCTLIPCFLSQEEESSSSYSCFLHLPSLSSPFPRLLPTPPLPPPLILSPTTPSFPPPLLALLLSSSSPLPPLIPLSLQASCSSPPH